jgi:F0F1-type ATP synthase assembly protein I
MFSSLVSAGLIGVLVGACLSGAPWLLLVAGLLVLGASLPISRVRRGTGEPRQGAYA